MKKKSNVLLKPPIYCLNVERAKESYLTGPRDIFFSNNALHAKVDQLKKTFPKLSRAAMASQDPYLISIRLLQVYILLENIYLGGHQFFH